MRRVAASSSRCLALASCPRTSTSAPRRSAGISPGRVSPCPTSVKTMTVSVTMTSASRAGNGPPAGRLVGSASAAASAHGLDEPLVRGRYHPADDRSRRLGHGERQSGELPRRPRATPAELHIGRHRERAWLLHPRLRAPRALVL